MEIPRFLFVFCLFLSACTIPYEAQHPSEPYKNYPLTVFEKDPSQTATYFETIAYYEKLAKRYDQIQLTAIGSTDSGHPLHVVVVSGSEEFDPNRLRRQNKLIFMINNGIHPGEPCGVDATMMLLRDMMQERDMKRVLEQVVLVVIPFYNIGGGLNRSPHTRANQVGPSSQGFRGNARNLDLNRDFIKCDSRNAQTFNKIFHTWQPDIFVDTHTSNGADYQYTMTLLSTQKDKLAAPLSKYLTETYLPFLYEDMAKRGWEMTPYVHVRNTPDEGIYAFDDLARYSSGYASLFNTLSFMSEAHMLKSYDDRVKSTYVLLDVMLKKARQDAREILSARDMAFNLVREKPEFPLEWQINFSESDKLIFQGYEAGYKTSEVTGQPRLFYNREKPYEKEISYYNTLEPVSVVNKPWAYIIPQAYQEVINRLRWNGVELYQLTDNVTLDVEMYRIIETEEAEAYESHYLHTKIEAEKENRQQVFYKGDFVVRTDQNYNRYIVETLEPQAPDSWFAWNFFDGILQRKEYFSAYVFEDKAAQLLRKDPDLWRDFQAKKSVDRDFAEDAQAQLWYIYLRSPYAEDTYRLYPVGRLMEKTNLPVEDLAAD